MCRNMAERRLTHVHCVMKCYPDVGGRDEGGGGGLSLPERARRRILTIGGQWRGAGVRGGPAPSVNLILSL